VHVCHLVIELPPLLAESRALLTHAHLRVSGSFSGCAWARGLRGTCVQNAQNTKKAHEIRAGMGPIRKAFMEKMLAATCPIYCWSDVRVSRMTNPISSTYAKASMLQTHLCQSIEFNACPALFTMPNTQPFGLLPKWGSHDKSNITRVQKRRLMGA